MEGCGWKVEDGGCLGDIKYGIWLEISSNSVGIQLSFVVIRMDRHLVVIHGHSGMPSYIVII